MTKECVFRRPQLCQPSKELKRGRTDGYQIPQQDDPQAEQGPIACAGVVGADGYDIRGGRSVAVVMVLVLSTILVSVFEEALARKDMVVPGLAVGVVVVQGASQQARSQDGQHDPSQKPMLRSTEHHWFISLGAKSGFV